MSVNSLWYKDAIFYELHVRAFKDSNADGKGDIPGLIEKLDYIQDLGVDCIWILPTYPSPLIDGGYDISDFYGVHPDFGTIDDFKRLVNLVHEKGMRIITDLVVNHTSDQHPWFQAARKDKQSPYRGYYVWSDTNQSYPEARVIFNDTLNSNWSWDEVAGQFYWHRFYPEQPDLNYDNPAVQDEMIKVMDYWLEIGVDGFRADAVPYLFEREGTNSDNLPETHQYLQRMRRFIDRNYPGSILLLEANQWPEDVRPYFADGNEAHMTFHFPIMPRIYMSLRKADRTDLVEILARTPPIPDNCQWATFLRNHDELTLEMVTEEDRQWMWKEYAPDPRMRLNLGIRRRLAPLMDNDHRKIKLLNAMLFSLPGAPTLYYGDEIGMGDNIWLHDRDGLRTPMQWDDSKNAGFSTANETYLPLIEKKPYDPTHVNVKNQQSDPESLYSFIKHLISLRKSNQALKRGDFSWVELTRENKSIAGYWRNYDGKHVLVINNLSKRNQRIEIKMLENLGPGRDLLSGSDLKVLDGIAQISLKPYAFAWVQFEN